MRSQVEQKTGVMEKVWRRNWPMRHCAARTRLRAIDAMPPGA